jgi:hypothetical protein
MGPASSRSVELAGKGPRCPRLLRLLFPTLAETIDEFVCMRVEPRMMASFFISADRDSSLLIVIFLGRLNPPNVSQTGPHGAHVRSCECASQGGRIAQDRTWMALARRLFLWHGLSRALTQNKTPAVLLRVLESLPEEIHVRYLDGLPLVLIFRCCVLHCCHHRR